MLWNAYLISQRKTNQEEKKKSRELVEFAKTIKANDYAVRFLFTKTDNIGFEFFAMYLRSQIQ
jgi:hypothetical protein